MGLLEIRDQAESAVSGGLKKVWDTVHPNVISGVRLPIGMVSLLVQQVDKTVGTILYLANEWLDWVDGAAARASGKTSVAWAKLDPLVDKMVHGSQLLYFVSQIQDIQTALGITFSTVVATNLWVNYHSQRKRWPIGEQIMDSWRAISHPDQMNEWDDAMIKANLLGKLKFLLESFAILALYVGNDTQEGMWVSTALLTIATTLWALGARKRTPTTESAPISEETK